MLPEPPGPAGETRAQGQTSPGSRLPRAVRSPGPTPAPRAQGSPFRPSSSPTVSTLDLGARCVGLGSAHGPPPSSPHPHAAEQERTELGMEQQTLVQGQAGEVPIAMRPSGRWSSCGPREEGRSGPAGGWRSGAGAAGGSAARLRERAQLQEQVWPCEGSWGSQSQPHPAGSPLPLGWTGHTRI